MILNSAADSRSQDDLFDIPTQIDICSQFYDQNISFYILLNINFKFFPYSSIIICSGLFIFVFVDGNGCFLKFLFLLLLKCIGH